MSEKTIPVRAQAQQESVLTRFVLPRHPRERAGSGEGNRNFHNPHSGSPPGHVPQEQRQRGVLHTPAAGGLLNAALSVESGAYCARAPEVLLYLRSRFTSRSPHLSMMMARIRAPCFALNIGESVETRPKTGKRGLEK